MAEDKLIQWHPAFCSAVELTLLDNADSLDYIREFNLSNKPLQVDLLVIEKEADVQIADEFGRIFKRHNLLEYKSPGDELNIDTYYKTIAYGCLYKSTTGKHVDEIKAKDITLTLIRREKPEELLDTLVAEGQEVSSNYPGIYHVKGNVLFDTQIISTKELPPGTHIWLKALTRNIEKAEAQQAVNDMTKFPQGSRERELADSVMQAVWNANIESFRIWKEEDPEMRNALREIMKPELDEAVDNNKKETAINLIHMGQLTDADIAKACGLTEAKVKKLREQEMAMA